MLCNLVTNRKDDEAGLIGQKPSESKQASTLRRKKYKNFSADKKARTNKTPKLHLFFNYKQDIASDQALRTLSNL
uniref:Uncharacterized protein n=1 Tax=Romanomermis culicivorax TaxID=13658 RepID=A0A915JY12_ROMCU